MGEQKVVINFKQLIYQSYTPRLHTGLLSPLSSFSHCSEETNRDEEGQGNYEIQKKGKSLQLCCVILFILLLFESSNFRNSAENYRRHPSQILTFCRNSCVLEFFIWTSFVRLITGNNSKMFNFTLVICY